MLLPLPSLLVGRFTLRTRHLLWIPSLYVSNFSLSSPAFLQYTHKRTDPISSSLPYPVLYMGLFFPVCLMDSICKIIKKRKSQIPLLRCRLWWLKIVFGSELVFSKTGPKLCSVVSFCGNISDYSWIFISSSVLGFVVTIFCISIVQNQISK